MAYKFISPTTHFVIAPLKGLVKGFCSKLLVNMSKSLIFVLDYILCTCSLVQGGLETARPVNNVWHEQAIHVLQFWEVVMYGSTSVVSLVAAGAGTILGLFSNSCALISLVRFLLGNYF